MIYAAFNSCGFICVGLYDKMEQFYADTFSPDVEIKHIIEFKVHGKTYNERQDSVRNTAIDFQYADSDMSGGLSWEEFARVTEWFTRMGKRYGLLEEFRENAII